MLQVLIFLKSNLPQFLFFLFPSPNLTILILILLLHPKHSTRREKITYICGLRTRIECEPLREHSTHSNRVADIGPLLSFGTSVLFHKSDNYPLAMIHLMLYNLRYPAFILLMLFFKMNIFILYFYLLIASRFSNSF